MMRHADELMAPGLALELSAKMLLHARYVSVFVFGDVADEVRWSLMVS